MRRDSNLPFLEFVWGVSEIESPEHYRVDRRILDPDGTLASTAVGLPSAPDSYAQPAEVRSAPLGAVRCCTGPDGRWYRPQR